MLDHSGSAFDPDLMTQRHAKRRARGVTVGAASLLGAVGLVLFGSGCRVVQLRYYQAVAPRANHPVEINLGYGMNRYWTNHGPVGPVAVTVAANRVAFVWPRNGRLQVVYRVFDRHGPCGPPGPASTVEHGRETITIACEPGIYPNDHWSSTTLPVSHPQLLAATFARNELWVAVAEETRVQLVAVALPTGKLTGQGSLPIHHVTAIQLRIADASTRPLLALIRKNAGHAEVELLRPVRGALMTVAKQRLPTLSPLALASYGSGYAVAFNDRDMLSVFTHRDRAHGLQLLRRYPLRARTLAIGALHGRLSIAATASLQGQEIFAAGAVAPGQLLKLAANPDDAAALAVSPGHNSETVVVSKPDPRAYANEVFGRATIRAFTTVRWSTTRHTFIQLAPLTGVVAGADAEDGLLAVFGGISFNGHPTHTAYVLWP
jgi:hypothetical protein